MKRYVKKVIAILMIMMMLSPNFINVVNAETTSTEEEINDIQISLLDGSAPNSTVLLDVNCDGIVTIRDYWLIRSYLAGHTTNITEKGLENMKMDSNTVALMASTWAQRLASGQVRMSGINEFEVGESIRLKAYYCSVSSNGNPSAQIGSETLSNVKWESSDENIAEIDLNGNVSFKNKGEVFITAIDENEDYMNICKFYVGNVDEIVQLTGDSIIKGSKESKANLKIDVSSYEKAIAGFKIKFVQLNSVEENEQLLGIANEIKSKTEGWEVTEINTEDDTTTMQTCYTFVVEPDDEYLDEENLEKIPQTLDIEFKFPVDSNSNIGGNVFAIKETIQVTDINNVVVDINDPVLLCKKLVDPILSVKDEVDSNTVNIVGNDIYVKSNDKNLTELYSKLANNLENFDYYYVEDYQHNAINNTEEISTGYLYVVGQDGAEYKYNLYAMGDICVDSTHSIDINDVVYLRKAIVGLYDEQAPTNYCLETTDVNNSNIAEDGTRELGDIGDVIEIRKRIVNNKWM